jgi:hypothetical protein
MALVSEAAKLYIPAGRVWRTIGDFGAIDDWHPAVISAERSDSGQTPERRLELGGPSPLVERLERQDDDARTLRTTLVEGPLGLAAMTAELRVNPDDASSCTVEWSAELTPAEGVARDDAVAAVQDFFRRGLEHLRFTLAG